jgi:Zn-finger nucleic acid-binding protein
MNSTGPVSDAPPVGGLQCGNCRQPMNRLSLAGHYGRPVDIDLCEPCHLLWFDSLEASRLQGPSMIRVVAAMAAAHRQPHHLLRPDVRCPRCAGALKRVVNRSRFGTAEQLECLRGHGTWSSFAQWLAERGLLRPLGSSDRVLLQDVPGGGRGCVNCGAPDATVATPVCAHCGSQFGVFDLARLAAAMDPERATEGAGLHEAPRRRHVYRCHACGHSEDGQHGLRCGQCGATQVSTDLNEVVLRLSEIESALIAHQTRPAAHVVNKRLQALESDLPRRREAVRSLEIGASPADGALGARDMAGDLASRLGLPGPAWMWRVGFWLAVAAVLSWWIG